MTKDLTIYPPPERCSVYPDCPIEFHEVGNWGPNKRLTNAELAAEYWAATLGNLWNADRNNGAQLILGRAQSQALHRLATLPHYDSEDQS